MMAAEAGHAAVCDYLVRQGADTFITNTRGTHNNGYIVAWSEQISSVI